MILIPDGALSCAAMLTILKGLLLGCEPPGIGIGAAPGFMLCRKGNEDLGEPCWS